MEEILQYFKELTQEQHHQLEMLEGLYREWNAKINVISRKDIDNLYEHHVLHSLAIAKLIQWKPCTRILDFGTGGGFPGIPLGKKIRVAQEVCNAIGLKNCQPEHLRGEDEKGKYDFIVSRAVMPLPGLYKMMRKNISKEHHNALPNGIICLKGGDLQEETRPFRNIVDTTDISQLFSEEWFKEKYIIYLPC